MANSGVTIGIVVAVGVFLAGMGAFAVTAPAALAKPFGIVVDRPESRSEIRAVYGGFGLATAAVLGVGLIVPELGAGVVLAVSFALGGMAVGRLVSRLVDRPTAFYPVWFYFVIETVAAVLLLVAVFG